MKVEGVLGGRVSIAHPPQHRGDVVPSGLAHEMECELIVTPAATEVFLQHPVIAREVVGHAVPWPAHHVGSVREARRATPEDWTADVFAVPRRIMPVGLSMQIGASEGSTHTTRIRSVL